jgi:hypothetical protein
MTINEASDSSSDQIPNLDSAPIEQSTDAVIDQSAEQTTDTLAVSNEDAKPSSLLDLVKDVVAKSEAEAPSSSEAEESDSPESSDATKPADQPSSDETDSKDEAKPEDDEKLPFHKHPRFQSVIREKNAYKAEAEAFQADATQFRAISDYMTQNGLTPEQVNDAFEIAAALRNDPLRAREMLLKTIAPLNILAGETLPDDVSQMVEDGDMSESAAKELAMARARIAIQEHQQRESLEKQKMISERNVHQQITSAVETWEQQVAARDPDYEAKKALVFKNIRLAHMDRPARNPQEAVAIAEAALKEATEILSSVMPKRTAMKQPVSTQSASHAKPQPKSLNDAISLALNS